MKEEYFADDRPHYKKFDILSEEENKKISAIFDQKEREYLERIKGMAKEERSIEFEKFDTELEQIFKQFEKKALERKAKEQKTAAG